MCRSEKSAVRLALGVGVTLLLRVYVVTLLLRVYVDRVVP